jgi:hypothetical protein
MLKIDQILILYPYEILPTPQIHFSSVDNMLKIDTQPGIIYKYTINGCTPTYNSLTC